MTGKPSLRLLTEGLPTSWTLAINFGVIKRSEADAAIRAPGPSAQNMQNITTAGALRYAAIRILGPAVERFQRNW